MPYLLMISLICSATLNQPQRQYAGQSLDYWERQVAAFDPKSPHSVTFVEPLLEIVQDRAQEAAVRRWAAVALGRIGKPGSARSVPVFIELLEDRSEPADTRVWVSRALGLLGNDASAATAALVAVVDDETLPVASRSVPLEALALIGSSHPDAIPALVRWLQYQPQDPSRVSAGDASALRGVAAEALGIVGRDAQLALPILVRIVRDPGETATTRRRAILALGELREGGALAIPAIVEAFEFDQTLGIREAAMNALARIGIASQPVLKRYLQHEDPELRWRSVQALGQLNAADRAFANQILALLGDPDETVRITVCETLRGMRVAEAVYSPPLVELLASQDRQVRVRALRLISEFTTLPAAQLDRLQHLAADPRPHVRRTAQKALDQLGGGDP